MLAVESDELTLVAMTIAILKPTHSAHGWRGTPLLVNTQASALQVVHHNLETHRGIEHLERNNP